jgi:hypothetical protein
MREIPRCQRDMTRIAAMENAKPSQDRESMGGVSTTEIINCPCNVSMKQMNPITNNETMERPDGIYMQTMALFVVCEQ